MGSRLIMDIFANILPSLQQAAMMISSPMVLLYLTIGVVMGLAIGVLPGLGGIAGLSLLLPFMFGMDPILGLSLMIGLIAVVPTSDTFASVLMGIPGSSASQATVLDGFPLAKKGLAAKALSAAFASSLFGGLVGALFLTIFIVVARPIVLSFGLPEMLMITMLGLSMVAILAGSVIFKGLAAAGLGLLVGTIGESDAGGSLRMASYDLPYIVDGFKLVIVGLGIFALPEIVSLLRQDDSIAKDNALGAGWFDGVKAWFQNIFLSIRCSLIGVVVGVIPGLGGSVVDWIAYGHTVQSTKDKSQFGQGEIRGVIGPESSNNAKEGGGLVPTLLFGIPGSGSMAIFIGAVALLGTGSVEVGPVMLENNLDITYAIVWLLALANVIGTILCIGASPQIAKLTKIRFSLIAPFLLMVIAFAAFQSGQNYADLLALFCFGLLGIFLKRFDWSRPAFLIGFVLSNPVEKFTNQAFQIANFRFRQSMEAGLDYIFSPIVLVLLLFTIISVIIGIRQSKIIHAEGGQAPSGAKRAPMIFLLFMLSYALVALYNASLISDRLMTDKVVPMFIALITVICCAMGLFKMMRCDESNLIFADREYSDENKNAPYGLWTTLSWFLMLLILTGLFGFIIALAVFLISFMRLRAKLSLTYSVIYSGAGLLFMLFLGYILNRDFPPGLLQAYVTLPWPFY